MSNVSDAINSSLDQNINLNPVITPTVDTSQIQNVALSANASISAKNGQYSAMVAAINGQSAGTVVQKGAMTFNIQGAGITDVNTFVQQATPAIQKALFK
jgi:hypothetical protein